MYVFRRCEHCVGSGTKGRPCGLSSKQEEKNKQFPFLRLDDVYIPLESKSVDIVETDWIRYALI